MACDGSHGGPSDETARRPDPARGSDRADRPAAELTARGTGSGAPSRTAAPVGLVLAVAVGLAAAPVLAPTPADAQQPDPDADADTVEIDTPYREIPRGLRLGVVGGYMDTGLTDLELGPQSTPVGGLRGRARVSSPISIEFSALYGSSDRSAVDPRLDGGPAPVDTVRSRWVLAEAVMQFAITGDRTWHRLQPFVTLGGGFLVGVDEEQSPEFSEGEAVLRHDIEVMPAVQAGLGVEWHLGERFGLSFEARDHLWRITTPGGFFDEAVLEEIRNAGAPAPEETSWTHNLEFSLTIYRYF